MKVEEIRVGNLVSFIDESGPSPDYIETTVGLSEIEKAIKDPDFFQGIPLTEQWLLDFGFDRHPNPNGTRSWCYYKDRERWVIQSMLDLNSFSFGITPLKPELNFVHQLQNLFYTLCGKELELKSEEEIR